MGSLVDAKFAELTKLMKWFEGWRLGESGGVMTPGTPSDSSTTTAGRSVPVLILEGEEDTQRVGTVGTGIHVAGPIGACTGSGGQPVAAPTNATGATAQINVVSAGVPAMAYYPGMVPDIWSGTPKPSFSGKPRDFAQFERDWEESERKYRKVGGAVCSDAHLLEHFLSCLDDATRRHLKLQRESRPWHDPGRGQTRSPC